MRHWSRKQLRVLKSLFENDERFTLVYGAVGSGKTAIAAASIVVWSTTVNQELFGIVAKTTAQTKDVVLPEMVKCCGELGIRFEKLDSQRYRIGRNTFRTFDGNDVSAIERIQGYNLAGLYVDEVVNMPEMILMEFDNRLRAGKDQRAIFTANPGNPAHWFKRQWVDRADEISMKTYRLLMEDNPGLSERFIESAKLTSAGGFYSRRVLGEWANMEGNVYTDFREPALPPDYDTADAWFVSVDPAESSVCHAILVGDFGGVYWICEEWRWDHKRQGQMSHTQMAAGITQWLGEFGIKITAGVCDSAAAAFRRELSTRARIRVAEIDKTKTTVYNGLRLTSAWLAAGKLRLGIDAPEIFAEMMSYAWDTKAAEVGEDRPVKGNDHAMDAMRYFVLAFTGRRQSSGARIRVR